MKYLKYFNEARLFNPNDPIKLDLEDICQELKDVGFNIEVLHLDEEFSMSEYRITIEKGQFSKWFKVTDCREVILRMIDYMEMKGLNNYKIISQDPSNSRNYGHYPKPMISINITETLPLGKFKRALSSKWSNTTNQITIKFAGSQGSISM